jgi:hypothetical protein
MTEGDDDVPELVPAANLNSILTSTLTSQDIV